MGRMSTQNPNYKFLDLLKLISAYLVVGIHTRPFQSLNVVLDKIFYYDISNYAVPFFYACTGYFLIYFRADEDIYAKIKNRMKKIIKVYLLLSAAYLPLTVYGWITEGKMSWIYLLRCIRNYVFVGENFYSWALWYLNGLIFALLAIDFWLKKYSLSKIAMLGSAVYLEGIVLTMLGGHQEVLPRFMAVPVKIYFSIFATTRNGLFQSLIFVAIGMMVAEKEKQGEIDGILRKGKILIPLYVAKIPISLIGGGQYLSQALDLPIFYGLFALIVFTNQKLNLQGKFYKRLRNFSGTIYYTHMYLVALCALVLYRDGYHNPMSFFICAGGATLIAVIAEFIKGKSYLPASLPNKTHPPKTY